MLQAVHATTAQFAKHLPLVGGILSIGFLIFLYSILFYCFIYQFLFSLLSLIRFTVFASDFHSVFFQRLGSSAAVSLLTIARNFSAAPTDISL